MKKKNSSLVSLILLIKKRLLYFKLINPVRLFEFNYIIYCLFQIKITLKYPTTFIVKLTTLYIYALYIVR